MTEQKQCTTDEDLQELRRKSEEALQRTDENLQETSKILRKIAATQDRVTVLSEKNEKAIAELNATSKRQDKSIGDIGNKFGKYTEALALPSFKRILDERFDAEYRGSLAQGSGGRRKDLQIDGWGKARNGSDAAFLVEIKSRFKPKHIRQVWRIVEKFREYNPEYRNRAVYPLLAVVEVENSHRELIWQSGIYLIDIADGVFKMEKPPAGFYPNGYHGSDAVRRDVPYLHLVRSDGEGKRTAQ